MERAGEVGVANDIEHGAAFLFSGDEGGPGEQGEVAGDDGEIDGAAVGDFADGAGAGALGEAGEEATAGRVGEGVKKGR